VRGWVLSLEPQGLSVAGETSESIGTSSVFLFAVLGLAYGFSKTETSPIEQTLLAYIGRVGHTDQEPCNRTVMDLFVPYRLRPLIIRLASQEELALRDAFQASPHNLPRRHDRVGQEGSQ